MCYFVCIIYNGLTSLSFNDAVFHQVFNDAILLSAQYLTLHNDYSVFAVFIVFVYCMPV